MIDPELLPEFVAEAGEHLDEMEANLIKLEADPDNREIINDIFRDVHTIKGSSAYLGLKITSELAHKLENLLELVRQGKSNADSSLIDLLIAAKDRMTSLVTEVENYQEERSNTDDLIKAIESFSSDTKTSGKQAGHPPKATDSALSPQVPPHAGSLTPLMSFSEEEFELDLGGLFDTEENQTHSPADAIASQDDFPKSQAQAQADSAPQESLSADPPVDSNFLESYDEAEDEELFTIYLEQLKIKLFEIRELAAQISSSENRSELLSAVNKKIQRLKASANYMGYEKLAGLYERWQATLESYQDRLFLNDPPSGDVLITEGINTYFDTIQKHFPQLQEIERVPLALDEFKLDLDGIFDTEENESNGPADSIESGNNSPESPSPVQSDLARQATFSDDKSYQSSFGDAYEETGDEELFAIYLEQLKINLVDIQKLAAQIFSSQNLSELLSAIKEKIQRLQASANYMSYDKLTDFYKGWEKKLESYQDRLFLNDAPSRDVLIEEGINAYFDAIQTHFPQLREIARVPIARKELRSATSPSTSSTNEYEENIDTELFSIFLEQLKDNLHAVQTLGQQLGTSNESPEIITAITEKITRIRAAANYMGYEKLTEFYDGWVDELNTFRAPSSPAPNGIDLSDRINGCIKRYTEKLLKDFPQINDAVPAAVDEAETTTEELHATPRVSADTAPALAPSEVSSPLDRTDELFSLEDTAEEAEHNLYEVPEIKEDEEADKDEDQILIDRLSAALDNALGTGLADKSAKESGQGVDIVALVEPDHNQEDPPQILQNIPEEKAVSSESLKPAELEQPQESVDLALSDDNNAAAPEPVERRKEERRKEDRRVTAEAGAEKVLRQSLRIDANKIDELMNQAGELVINRAWFSQLFNELRRLELHLQSIPELDKREFKQVKGFSFKFHEAIVALGRVANDLQEGVMKVRMLPISQLFNRYPRLIRDLVHDSDKDIKLELRGADTELDKMIIEEIADPLIHVIRNAVDHGIEPASTRKMMGKPEKGLLKLDAYHEGSHVVIEVTDDGRGINPEEVKATALKKGLVNKDQLSRMSLKEITELIMRPGFSTAAQVSRTSGRGVGMDVVRKNLENLNGTIEIDSQPGKGTSFRIKIPLTLAVIKALLVRVRDALFTIPLITVDETLRVRAKDINSIKGNEVIYLRDSTIPLIRLSTIFNLPSRSSQESDEDKFFVVIVSAGNSRVGLVVDELRGQEDVVIKPLPDYLRDNKGFSGATILGDGRISLILDIHELVNLTIGRQSRRLSEPSRMTSEIL